MPISDSTMINKKLMPRFVPVLLAATSILLSGPAHAADAIKPRALSISEFVRLAAQNDTVFEEILIDNLFIKYRRATLLPTNDVILSIKHQYNFYLDQDREEPELDMSLSRLFPAADTDVSLSYSKASSSTVGNENSELQLLISQPVAKNAFGRGTKLQDKIIGIENDVIRYQIVEAYEDYLAALTTAYYSWYSAYENLKVGKASYRSNLKLLDNIHERQRQNIALPVDVNKMKLLVEDKKESLVVLQEVFNNIGNIISEAIRHTGSQDLIPLPPNRPASEVQFERDYKAFTQTSRTYKTLNLLERQSTLEVKKAADDLLPSTRLLLGYKLEGKEWGINNRDRVAFAGISVEWPIGRTVDKAKHSIAKIEHQKTALSNQNKYDELHTNLKNLNLQIKREQELIGVADKKINLAEAILKDEAENYSFGKITLNDYLDAVNRVDENRFNRIDHMVQLNKLLVEWLRLTDKLVDESVLKRNIGKP